MRFKTIGQTIIVNVSSDDKKLANKTPNKLGCCKIKIVNFITLKWLGRPVYRRFESLNMNKSELEKTKITDFQFSSLHFLFT